MVGSPQRFVLMKDTWIFTALALLLSGNVYRADKPWPKLSGPFQVYRGYRNSTDFRVTSFDSRSLIACVSACVEYGDLCVSVNYKKVSGRCELLPHRSGDILDANSDWSTVILTHQRETTSVITTSATTTPGCRNGFMLFANKCYFMDKKPTTALDAVVVCAQLSAELLSIETLEEQHIVDNLMANYHDDNQWWTSGQGTGVDRYQWSSTGIAFTHSNFTTGFPGGYYSTESCVYIDGYLGWKTDSCQYGKYGVICENSPP